MAKKKQLYGFSKRDHKRVSKVVRAVEQFPPLPTRPKPKRWNFEPTAFLAGKLDDELSRGSISSASTSATVSIWVDGSDTGENIEVVDRGFIPAAASPLPVGLGIVAAWISGEWVLLDFDCDGV